MKYVVLWRCWLGGRKGIRPVKTEWWVAGVVICLERRADLHTVWARGGCRISPPRFLAECCKRQLNQVNSVLLYFRLSAFSDLYWVCLSVFSCTVLFVSISQVIGCEDRRRNDLYCVEWGVKLYSNQPAGMVICLQRGADLHMAQLMPLPLTVCCSSKIQIGFTFLVPTHTGSPGKRAVKRVCVCVCVRACVHVKCVEISMLWDTGIQRGK